MATLLVIEVAILLLINVVLYVKYKTAAPLTLVPWNGCTILAIDDEGEEVFYWDYELNVYVGGTVNFFVRTGGGCVIFAYGDAIFLSEYVHRADVDCILAHERGHIALKHEGYYGIRELWEEVQADYYATKTVGKMAQLRLLQRKRAFSKEYLVVPKGMKWKSFCIDYLRAIRTAAIVLFI